MTAGLRRLRRLAGVTRPELDQWCENVRFEADRFASVPQRALSAGNKQKLALIAAFVREPSILLLDEPSTALDAETATAARTQISKAVARGCTTLIATHDPADLAGLEPTVTIRVAGGHVQLAPAEAATCAVWVGLPPETCAVAQTALHGQRLASTVAGEIMARPLACHADLSRAAAGTPPRR